MLRLRTIILAIALVAGLGPLATASSGQAPSGLFPEIEPFDSGHLRVSDLHEIYWERCGNPEGKPVIVLHGGPGVGSYPRLRQYFNPKKFHIVLHDQRGTGRSRPAGETAENTTRDLVADIEGLRQHLELGKIVIFGGSWGSTLGLAYAETHPDHVTAMVLRGIFTATREEIDHHYLGARRFFPRMHDELLATLPDPDRRPLPEYLLEMIRSNDPGQRHKTLMALARFEMKMSSLRLTDEMLNQILAQYPAEAMQPISSI
ncbi:MAG: alpha/beta fold hydrolase, partial [bacterium]|nr:alpha/beta fold hydrolase [bacterium]